MNERIGNNKIYLLAKEAGLIEFEQLDWNPELVSPTYESVAKARKFAELIVRECMKESMDEIVSDEDIAETIDPLAREYLKGNNQGIVDAVVRFRNYFGVEE